MNKLLLGMFAALILALFCPAAGRADFDLSVTIAASTTTAYVDDAVTASVTLDNAGPDVSRNADVRITVLLPLVLKMPRAQCRAQLNRLRPAGSSAASSPSFRSPSRAPWTWR